jgi:hypothetical protein
MTGKEKDEADEISGFTSTFTLTEKQGADHEEGHRRA